MSKDFNKVVLVGNLTKDSILSTTKNDNSVCSFSIAMEHQSNKESVQTCFIRVAVFGKFAVSCSQYLKKGRRVLVEGKLVSSFQEIGDKRILQHSIFGDNVILLDSPKVKSENGN